MKYGEEILDIGAETYIGRSNEIDKGTTASLVVYNTKDDKKIRCCVVETPSIANKLIEDIQHDCLKIITYWHDLDSESDIVVLHFSCLGSDVAIEMLRDDELIKDGKRYDVCVGFSDSDNGSERKSYHTHVYAYSQSQADYKARDIVRRKFGTINSEIISIEEIKY